jgi:3-phosphoshikimate 1-carboxyvinyltransferase
MLSAKTGQWTVNAVGENAEESPYVVMTSKLIDAFPKSGRTFQIEPDASSGSYFVAADHLALPFEWLEHSDQFGIPVLTTQLQPISVKQWPSSDLQVDQRFVEILEPISALHYGLERARGNADPDDQAALNALRSHLKAAVISRNQDLGDSIMTAMVLAPFSLEPIHFTDLGRMRLQECERVQALRIELTKCGAKVIEKDDRLEVFPSELHGAEIETYNDHRMAMCFAILGLKVPGIKIKNPSCVKKTFPNFFQKLATEPPHGLGVTILDGKSKRKLGLEELFAE